MKKYSINVHWSDEDGCFVALVPEFPTLSAFGETREAAIQEAEIALQGFIDIYNEEGYDLPEPKKLQTHSGQLRIRIPKTLHSTLSTEAERQGVSLNTYINVLLSERNVSSSIENKLQKIEAKITGPAPKDIKKPETAESMPSNVLTFQHFSTNANKAEGRC